MTSIQADYQQFEIEDDGSITHIGPRMAQKMQAIRIPNLNGKEVLDIGCDFGFWSFQSALQGAKRVVGLDRNREVRNVGKVNLIELNTQVAKAYPVYHKCEFQHINLGKQWRDIGKFDVVYLFSLYHHIYHNTGGDHSSIWYWLHRQLKHDGVLIWENPMDATDVVVQRNVAQEYHENYTPEKILESAAEWFEIEYIGGALHETTRSVWRFYPKVKTKDCCFAELKDGAGGASKAFTYKDNRRIKEISQVLGITPIPGSLNAKISVDFDYNQGYLRAEILDVADRSKGLDSEWKPRWARFYPVQLHGIDCYAFRFEGENYPTNFVELIADVKLRDVLDTESKKVTLCR